MKYQSVLPEDFDGTFRFTNWTDEDFIGKWGGKEYTFIAQTTSPIIMHDQTPLEIQSIRKKFAKDLAEREYFKGKSYENMRLREGEKDELGMIKPRGHGMSHAGQYNLNDLIPFIQKCLEPLTVVKAEVTIAPKVLTEDKLSVDEQGELNTIAIQPKGDLIEEKKKLRRKALGE